MMIDNPLNPLAEALYAALYRDLPPVRYQDRDWERYRAWRDSLSPEERRQDLECPGDCLVDRERPHRHSDVEVMVFLQTWSSTALGYGGMGGQAITPAYTVIVISRYYNQAAVYFGGSRLAYVVNSDQLRSAEWTLAIQSQVLPDVKRASELGWS